MRPEQDSEAGAPEPNLEARLRHLEARLDGAATEVRTHRLVLEDAAGEERLVAEMVGDVTELRIELPGSRTGHRSAVVLFGAGGRDDAGLGAGVGLQLWANGDLVGEITYWVDDDFSGPTEVGE